MRFEQIGSAEAAYKESRDTRASILGEGHPESQVVYVIPEKSIEDLKVLEAANRNENYDPCADESLTLEECTNFINEKNQEIKDLFKAFCEAPRESDERKTNEEKLANAKNDLASLLSK